MFKNRINYKANSNTRNKNIDKKSYIDYKKVRLVK